MGIAATSLIVVIAAIVLIAAAGFGILVLIKLRVIAKYAFAEELSDAGHYALEDVPDKILEKVHNFLERYPL